MKPGATLGAKPHPLVKWSMYIGPRTSAGWGVYIEKFERAMRLQWPWYAWTYPSRPWQGTTLSCDMTYMELFRDSTGITIGNMTSSGIIDRCKEVP
jgi:hypothetical protein